MEAGVQAGCCMIIWIMTLAVCFMNAVFCIWLSAMVLIAGVVAQGAGIAFLVIFFIWNLVCTLMSLCQTSKTKLKTNCYRSCLSVSIASAISFTFTTRYLYFEQWPRYPWMRQHGISLLLVHKVGLIVFVCGIPVIYGCKWSNLINDKKIIYKVIVDFIDIYEMAEVLDLGAPSCTPPLQPTYAQYNHGIPHSYCSESTIPYLKKGSPMEISVQVFCSLSFLIFGLFYKQILKESNDEDNGCIKKCVMISRLLQDISFSVIRICVWVLYGFEPGQFIFLVKNAVSVGLASLKFCECCSSAQESNEATQTSRASNERQQRHQQTNRGFDSNAI